MERTAGGVALLFPGQGAQRIRMGAGLYRHDPVFTAAMDEVFAGFGDRGDAVRADWLAERPVVSIDDAARSQLLLFGIGYALGRVALDWGLQPAGLLGHSAGEVAAATLAGVFTVPAAATMMADRVDRLAEAPPGGMLAVAANADAVAPFLHGDVALAAVNSPRQVMIAGPAEPLAQAGEALREAGFTCRVVPANAAFHSPALADVARRCLPIVAAATPGLPTMPLYSGYTAAPLREQAADPEFWARQPCAPVLFWPALDALLGTGVDTVLEAGPSQSLAMVARLHPAAKAGRVRVLAMLPARSGDAAADVAALGAAREAVLNRVAAS